MVPLTPLANDMDDMIWAVVPVKPLTAAKQRLSPLLQPAERKRIMLQLLMHVVQTLRATPAIARIVVVSRDPSVQRLAATLGATTLAEPDSGLNGALTFARRAIAGHASHLLILPGDLPLLRVDDVIAMVRHAPAGAICGDRHHAGTNALLLPAAAAYRFQYGYDSFARHCREFERLKIAYRQVRAAGIMFDLDTPGDWRAWQSGQATLIKSSVARPTIRPMSEPYSR